MPRVHTQVAAKDYPREGIKKGQKYYKWKFRFGPLIRSATYPKASQLTQSEFLSQVYDLQDRIAELTLGPDLESQRDEIAQEIRDLGEEQQDKQYNMPDALQYSPTGELLESRAQECDAWADELEGVSIPEYADPDEVGEEPDPFDQDEPDPADFEDEEDDEDYKAAMEQYEADMDEWQEEFDEWEERQREVDEWENDGQSALDDIQACEYNGE